MQGLSWGQGADTPLQLLPQGLHLQCRAQSPSYKHLAALWTLPQSQATLGLQRPHHPLKAQSCPSSLPQEQQMGFLENGTRLSAYALAHKCLQTCSLPSPPHPKRVETIRALVVEGTALPSVYQIVSFHPHPISFHPHHIL